MATTPGTIRPGGRTSRVRDAVLDATLQTLADSGYAGLSIERVAERSGVHKSTIYRRWQTKETMLAEAVRELAAQMLPIPSTGAIESDLESLARSVVDVLCSENPLVAGVVRALFADAAYEPQIAELKRNLYNARHEAAAAIIEAAVGRGELPPDTDARDLVGLVVAPIYYRKLVTGDPVDHSLAARAAHNALTAARAGACRQSA
jgi:AcrR family transcriptional regulator